MKQLSIILLAVVAFVAVACGGSTGVSENGPEYTSAYICPMHCEGSGSAKAGTCPTCKMAYVPNEAFKSKDNHKGHDHGSHEGHDHGSHDGHNHGDHEGHDHGSHDGHNHGDHEGHDHGSHEGHNH